MERWLSLGCGGEGQTIWEVGDRGADRGRGPRRKSVECQCIRVLSGFLSPPLKCGLEGRMRKKGKEFGSLGLEAPVGMPYGVGVRSWGQCLPHCSLELEDSFVS